MSKAGKLIEEIGKVGQTVRKDGWVLVGADNIPVKAGIRVSSRDQDYVLKGGRPPHKLGSTGRVYVTAQDRIFDSEFFPTVFGLKWVKEE